MFDVGKRIKDIREEKNISLTELARKAGIAQSSLSYIESGHNKPTVYTIEKICQALGISLVGFFDVQYWVTIDRLMRSGCRKTYNDYGIYICHGRKKPVKCRHQQRTKYIHKKVLGELKKLINNTKTIQRLCNEKEEFSRSRENEIAQKITAINNKLKDVDKFLLRLDDDYKAGNLSAPLYSKHYEESIREKELLDAQLVKAKNNYKANKKATPDIGAITSKARIVLGMWDKLNTPDKKIVINSFFPRIEVDKQGRLYIKKSIPLNVNFVSGIWSDN